MTYTVSKSHGVPGTVVAPWGLSTWGSGSWGNLFSDLVGYTVTKTQE